MSRSSSEAPLFADRSHAGRVLASALTESGEDPGIVFGLARGGVPVAAQVAGALGAPLDALAVRKIGHPEYPEFALGAVAADGPVVFHDMRGVAADARARPAVQSLINRREKEAKLLDERLHADVPALDPRGSPCTLVDDGLATGATMIAACRWARERGASRVVAAFPVGSDLGVAELHAEADAVICPQAREDFWAVSLWYRDFPPTDESEVIALLRAARKATPASGLGTNAA